MVATLWRDFGVRKQIGMRITNHLQKGAIYELRKPDSQWRNGDVVACLRSRNHFVAKCKYLSSPCSQHFRCRSQFDSFWNSHQEVY
jgi:hypothetical protein